MVDPRAEWYRAWAKEKQPSPWVDAVLGIVSIVVLATIIVTFLRSV